MASVTAISDRSHNTLSELEEPAEWEYCRDLITVHRQDKFLQTQFCACKPLDFPEMSLNVQN